MSSIEEAIVYILTNDATVSGLVSDRVVPIVQRDGVAFPFITYEVESAVITHSLSGPYLLNSKNINIACYAETYAETREIEKALQSALDGYKGLVDMGGGSTLDVRNINWMDQQDVHYTAEDGSDISVYSSETRYACWFIYQNS